MWYRQQFLLWLSAKPLARRDPQAEPPSDILADPQSGDPQRRGFCPICGTGQMVLVDDPFLLHDIQFHGHSRAIAAPRRRVETGKKELPDDGEAWSP